MEDPVARVKRLKESGAIMTLIEKTLYIRAIFGLGLLEAVDKLKTMGNYYEGPWTETPK